MLAFNWLSFDRLGTAEYRSFACLNFIKLIAIIYRVYIDRQDTRKQSDIFMLNINMLA